MGCCIGAGVQGTYSYMWVGGGKKRSDHYRALRLPGKIAEDLKEAIDKVEATLKIIALCCFGYHLSLVPTSIHDYCSSLDMWQLINSFIRRAVCFSFRTESSSAGAAGLCGEANTDLQLLWLTPLAATTNHFVQERGSAVGQPRRPQECEMLLC